MGGGVSITQVKEFLDEITYPVKKVQIVIQADKKGLESNQLKALSMLPNKTFYSSQDVKRALQLFKDPLEI